MIPRTCFALDKWPSNWGSGRVLHLPCRSPGCMEQGPRFPRISVRFSRSGLRCKGSDVMTVQ